VCAFVYVCKMHISWQNLYEGFWKSAKMLAYFAQYRNAMEWVAFV